MQAGRTIFPDDSPSGDRELEQRLSDPSAGAVSAMSELKGDLLILGVGGKMGPSLARMARRASDLARVSRRIIGVSRFSNPRLQTQLESNGIEAISCDLLAQGALDSLPDAPNILFLAGMKFGSTGQEPATWAMNTLLPALVCRRYPGSRTVALSTGNIYGLTPIANGGSRVTDPRNAVGEYAMSCLGRERMFEFFSTHSNTPVALIRLNYACDLRYGVLVDLAQKLLKEQPVDLGMGFFNTIWQGDANAIILQAFREARTPASCLNLTGPETLSVRTVCEELGRLLGKRPIFMGQEGETALLSNSAETLNLFGPPKVTAGQLVQWVAEWVRNGGAILGKPTKFEARDGRF